MRHGQSIASLVDDEEGWSSEEENPEDLIVYQQHKGTLSHEIL